MPERTAAYISQLDDHYGELTVRETLEFAARVQGGRLGEPIVRSELFLGSEGVWGRKAYGEKWRMERMQRQERPVPAMIASGSGSAPVEHGWLYCIHPACPADCTFLAWAALQIWSTSWRRSRKSRASPQTQTF